MAKPLCSATTKKSGLGHLQCADGTYFNLTVQGSGDDHAQAADLGFCRGGVYY